MQEDYQVLEEAVQKSEAEIRKHIRIEQQLKIYLDSLEEKVENYEKKLALEEMKYNQLFEVPCIPLRAWRKSTRKGGNYIKN